MGKEQIAALIAILEAENSKGQDSLALGTWTIHYDKGREAFVLAPLAEIAGDWIDPVTCLTVSALLARLPRQKT